jgi:glyoxylase-like metal-dependent hydrolase (beta-lactamase superfamily II)
MNDVDRGSAHAGLAVPGRDVVGVRAENPGIFTLHGTNSWVVGREPAWLVDPGPGIDAHVHAVAEEVDRRGGLGGVVLTHDHSDHVGALSPLRALYPDAPVAAARGPVDELLQDGGGYGPLTALATPGHAPDHFTFLAGDVLFSGDAVLGEGSVFIAPDPGALASYLAALERLRQLEPAIICPGHGPLVLDARARLTTYIDHRLDRERRLVEALDRGCRSVDELLDAAWSDVPMPLRGAAAVTLIAHLDKLGDEGRLPPGVQRPELPDWLSAAH